MNSFCVVYSVVRGIKLHDRRKFFERQNTLCSYGPQHHGSWKKCKMSFYKYKKNRGGNLFHLCILTLLFQLFNSVVRNIDYTVSTEIFTQIAI